MSAKPRKPTPKFTLKSLKKAEFNLVLAIVVFAALIFVASMFTGLEKVWQEFSKLSWQLIVGIFALAWVNFFFRGLRWHISAKKIGLKVPFYRIMFYYLIGMSMVITPGKLGTALRLWFLKKLHNINYSKTVPIMVMDPITDVTAAFILCLLGAVAFPAYGATLLFFGGVLAIIILLFAKPKLFVKALKGLYGVTTCKTQVKTNKKRRLFAKIIRVIKRLAKLMSPKVFTLTVACATTAWLASSLALWWLMLEMGAPITYLQAAFIMGLSTFIGGASMTPGGLGTAEATIFALFMALNIPPETAIAATALIRITILWFGVFTGFCLLPFGLKMVRE